MFFKVGILIVCFVSAAVTGCRLISGGSNEMVLAATEVGKPQGPAITKEIGPAGGTLASPDGRVMLTVPQNALAETITFSIQPITNALKTGLGDAYRFGPDGKTFSTPLELSIRYDNGDIDGSVPEALAVAFQDNGRTWHILNPKSFDRENKWITVPILHFTDFAFLSRFRIQPLRATIHPKEHQVVELIIECPQQSRLNQLFGSTEDCSSMTPKSLDWRLGGPGSMETLTSKVGVFYTAPDKKPAPNVATISLTLEFSTYDLKALQMIRVQKVLASQITIVETGYRASGQSNSMSYSGVICDLAKPFVINGSIAGSINFKWDFMPTSPGAGAFTMVGGGPYGAGVFTGKGSGTYTVVGLDTDNPKILTNGSGSGTGTAYGRTATGSKSGEVDFHLQPLENSDCTGN
jgi:hypothetical protein